MTELAVIGFDAHIRDLRHMELWRVHHRTSRLRWITDISAFAVHPWTLGHHALGNVGMADVAMTASKPSSKPLCEAQKAVTEPTTCWVPSCHRRHPLFRDGAGWWWCWRHWYSHALSQFGWRLPKEVRL